MDKKNNRHFQDIVRRLETLVTLRKHLLACDVLMEAVRARAEKCTVNYTGDVRVQESHEHDKIGNAVAKMEEIEARKEAIVRELYARTQSILDLTTDLSDRERQVIRWRYMGRTQPAWPVIASALGVSERTAYRVHDSAIWKMVIRDDEEKEVQR